MSTPTDYDLSYDEPLDVEGGCGSTPGGVEPSGRPQQFCSKVEILPSEITIGGLTFKPTVINTISGPHLVLAVY